MFRRLFLEPLARLPNASLGGRPIGRRLAIVGAVAAGVGFLFGSQLVHAATCTGASPCNACKNCSACAHCKKRGGTCGVCRRGMRTADDTGE